VLEKQCVHIYLKYVKIAAGIAQLGEQQTEVSESRDLEVACSTHAPGIFLPLFSAAKDNLQTLISEPYVWFKDTPSGNTHFLHRKAIFHTFGT
jgi:hypothetical protein